MTTKIYSYGVVAERQSKRPSLVEPTPRSEFTGQMKSGEEYYNCLVTNENNRRASIAAKRRELYPDYESRELALAAANATVESVLAECRDYRRVNRTTKVSKELTASLKSAKTVRKIAADAEKAMRKAIWDDPRFLTHVKEIDDRTQAEHRRLRGATPLFWGSYQAVEEAIQAAKTKKAGGDLRCKKRHGEGTVAYHFQVDSKKPNHMTWDVAAGGNDRRMKVYPDPVQLSKHRRRWWCEFWLRTDDSVKPARPIYVKVPFVRHRPLPDGAIIKWVKLHRFKLGTRWKYELQFTISFDSHEESKVVPEGTVAIDVGWRLLGDGSVRVAYWVGSDGRQGEILIPEKRVSAFLHGRTLQNIRDKRFDSLRPMLAAWLAAQSDLPQSHRDRFRTLAHWRSTQGLAKAAWWWRHNRLPGDDATFAELDAFRIQENHLYDWQANESQKFQDWRKWFYRNAISHKTEGLAVLYGRARIEDKFLAEIQAKPEPGTEVQADFQKHYKNVSSCSILIQAIEEGFGAARVTQVRREYTTMTCHACKCLCDVGAELIHTCEHCGLSWDQDANAAKNILDDPASPPVANAQAVDRSA